MQPYGLILWVSAAFPGDLSLPASNSASSVVPIKECQETENIAKMLNLNQFPAEALISLRPRVRGWGVGLENLSRPQHEAGDRGRKGARDRGTFSAETIRSPENTLQRTCFRTYFCPRHTRRLLSAWREVARGLVTLTFNHKPARRLNARQDKPTRLASESRRRVWQSYCSRTLRPR